MKKRELKQYYKEVQKFTTNSLSHKDKRNASSDKKVKLPYKMFQAMRQKSVDRFKEQKDMDKKLGIVFDTSRKKKFMQSYFEDKHHQKEEDKKQRKDTERGINMHLHSAAKYKDGALFLTKDGIAKIEGREPQGKFGKQEGQKRSFEQITKVRESNPEYMTGKRFRKKKGNVAKKFKSNKKSFKKHKKH